jgi:hypothetical protein
MEFQRQYRDFLTSKKQFGKFQVRQTCTMNCTYEGEKHRDGYLRGINVSVGDRYSILISNELKWWVDKTTYFKRELVKPPVDIGILPESVNEVIRDYAVDDYPKAYKKRRKSLRCMQRNPIEVDHR